MAHEVVNFTDIRVAATRWFLPQNPAHFFLHVPNLHA